ncbi:hypothetical protein IW261DRAFT_1426245 [Armillaria novae-zelandiae]|uniref:Uncharacterized protein n=1 Tax=Armillaria novae-zelandiae TaxID=153914 RepID=A0AA39NN23_9AGAR|nr:hypothetical protein IW261DRAFT_1426245 [Armillaria novae-zelandiae]
MYEGETGGGKHRRRRILTIQELVDSEPGMFRENICYLYCRSSGKSVPGLTNEKDKRRRLCGETLGRLGCGSGGIDEGDNARYGSRRLIDYHWGLEEDDGYDEKRWMPSFRLDVWWLGRLLVGRRGRQNRSSLGIELLPGELADSECYPKSSEWAGLKGLSFGGFALRKIRNPLVKKVAVDGGGRNPEHLLPNLSIVQVEVWPEERPEGAESRNRRAKKSNEAWKSCPLPMRPDVVGWRGRSETPITASLSSLTVIEDRTTTPSESLLCHARPAFYLLYQLRSSSYQHLPLMVFRTTPGFFVWRRNPLAMDDSEESLFVGNVIVAFSAIPSYPSLHLPSPLPSLVFGSPSPALWCTKS